MNNHIITVNDVVLIVGLLSGIFTLFKIKKEKSFIIVLLVTISYIVMSWSCLIIMYKLRNIDSISYIITLCNAVVMTALTGYFIKARGENITKIKANPDFLKMETPRVIQTIKHISTEYVDTQDLIVPYDGTQAEG